MPLTWRIYYGDGSTFSNTDGPPEAAPGLGVQVIAQGDSLVGRVVLHGGDLEGGYYWHEAGAWQHGDLFGLWDYLQRPGLKIVKFGRTVPTERFREILQRAINDPGLPRKSASYPGERTA